MGREETISVTLSEELSDSVREAVDCGDYASPDAVVAQAMRLWQREREQVLAKLRAMIEEGLKGPFEPWEGAAAIVAELKKRRATGGG